MKRIYFDTETSGLVPGNIGQLSAIIEENGIIRGYNRFFQIDYITDEAAIITNRNIEFYQIASNGKRFKDYKDEITEIFSNALLIAHNIKFDLNFLSTELWRQDIIFKPLDTFDSMIYFKDKCKIPDRTGKRYKNPKLEEIVEYFDVNRVVLNTYAKNIFNIDGELEYHDAMYDTTALYVCMKIEADILNGTNYFKDAFK